MFPEQSVDVDSERSSRSIGVPLAEVVLQDFTLRRVDGTEDGHIGEIAVSRTGRLRGGGLSYRVAFADDDGSERGRAQFRWIDVGSIASSLAIETLEASGIEDSRILGFGTTLVDQVPLLAGFSFSRQGGGDHHLREVAVTPVARGYSVTFRDDSPGDDRFLASVDLALVPSVNVISRHTQRFEDAVGSVDVPRESGQAALCGFSFKYRDSDHHIRHLQVGVSGDRIRMAMRDNDRSRRFEATIEYALIRE